MSVPITKERIFITGASGCIGHYIVDQLLENKDIEVHVMLRYPQRLRRNPMQYTNLFLHIGDLENIDVLKPVIATMHRVIHIATVWSNSDHAVQMNRDKTHELFSYCDPAVCKKIINFSTASILGPGNKPIDAALEHGTGYIRGKYLCYQSLPDVRLADRITTVFPTMVFGGSDKHPYSHISSGIIPNIRYARLIRFFDLDASFHFLHAKDIAQVAIFAAFNDTDKDLVLGQKAIQANDAINILCKLFKIPVYFKIPIRASFVYFLAKLFRIKLAPWDRHCIDNPHMTYKTVNPETFGLKSAFPTIKTAIEDLQ